MRERIKSTEEYLRGLSPEEQIAWHQDEITRIKSIMELQENLKKIHNRPADKEPKLEIEKSAAIPETLTPEEEEKINERDRQLRKRAEETIKAIQER